MCNVMFNLICNNKSATIWVELDSSRCLEDLVAKEEVEIEQAVPIVV